MPMCSLNMLNRIKGLSNWAKNWRRIDQLGISPFFAILVLAISSLFIYYLFYIVNWSNTGDGNKFISVIYLVTFIILVFYTYYTFQIAKFTAKGQALLYVQIQHSNVLKEFLKRWESSLGTRRHTCENPTRKQENQVDYEKGSLSNSWEYRDFIDYHLPSRYSNLASDWLNFNKMNRELDKMSFDLYSKLKLNMQSEILDISTKYNMKLDMRYFDNFAAKMYGICFEYINNKTENLESELVLKGNEIYCLQVDGMEVFFKDDKDKMEYAKMRMDNFIRRDNLMNNYKYELDQIIAKLDERDIVRNELRNSLNELIQRPLFAGTECDMLRDFYK